MLKSTYRLLFHSGFVALALLTLLLACMFLIERPVW